MKDILSDSEIVALINSNEGGYDKNDPETLIYNNIFPYLKVPDVQTKAMTNILVAVDKTGKLRSNPSFCNVKVTIWVLSHQDHMRVKNRNGNRVDLISDRIEKIFRGSKKYGFSQMDDFPSIERLLGDKFIYREITFRTSDTIKPACALGG